MAADFNFEGFRVLITGASGGIGKVLAQELFDRGAHVGVHYYKNKPKLKDFISNGNSNQKDRLCFLKANLMDLNEAERLFKGFISWAGKIDGLINNAGDVSCRRHFLEVRENDIDADLALNLKAPFWLSKLVIKNMEENEIKGSIINVSSIAAKYGGSLETLFYGLSKSALEVMSFSLSRYCAPLGIRINALRLGVFDTPFHKRHSKNLSQRIQMIPAKRMGKPEEAVRWIMYLLDQNSAYMNGQVISLTGGE